MRLLVWLVRVAIFFTLFAFALNNQHASSVYWFFGYEWRAPMVFVVLAAFGLGELIALSPSAWPDRVGSWPSGAGGASLSAGAGLGCGLKSAVLG